MDDSNQAAPAHDPPRARPQPEPRTFRRWDSQYFQCRVSDSGGRRLRLSTGCTLESAAVEWARLKQHDLNTATPAEEIHQQQLDLL